MKKLLFLLVSIIFITFSCTRRSMILPTVPPSLDVSNTDIYGSRMAFKDTIKISTGDSWSISGIPDWITLSDDKGGEMPRTSSVIVSVAANQKGDSRIAHLKVTTSHKTKIIQITQAGKNSLIVSKTDIQLSSKKTKDSIIILTSGEWKVEDDLPKGVSVTPKEGIGAGRIVVVANENTSTQTRKGEFTIRSSGKTVTVAVSQAGIETVMGTVGIDVPRVEDKEVSLDLNYNADINNNLRIRTPPQPLFSTGLYAAPGDTLSVSVPSSVTGLSVQIGAWPDAVSDIPNMDPTIVTTATLQEGSNKIISKYGGPVYIQPNHPIENPVTFTFSGAVEEPDFILGQTNSFTWWQKVNNIAVPWVELKAKNVILTVSRKKLLDENIVNPTLLLKTWDRVIEKDIYGWIGLSKNPSDDINKEPMLPYRIVLDSRISPADAHGGYPIVLSGYGDKWNMVGNINKDTWDLLRLLGTNFQQPTVWSWDALKNTTNYLYFMKYAKKLGQSFGDWSSKLVGVNLRSAFGKTLNYVQSSSEKHFDQDLTDSLAKLLPLAQIFERANPANGNGNNGYDFMTFLSKKARTVTPLPVTALEKHDFLYETLCDYTTQNWLLFFKSWGIYISETAQSDIDQKGYPYLFKKVWTYNPITDTGGTGYYHEQVDTSNWTIQAGNNSTNALPSQPFSNIIDRNINTSWQWYWYQNPQKSDFPNTPYVFIIDIGKPQLFNEFSVWQVQDATNGYVKEIQLKVSNNKTDWTDLGKFTMSNSSAKAIAKGDKPYTYNLTSNYKYRYIKLMILSNVADSYVNISKNAYLAEFSLYFGKE